jgi:hypothetical protein
MNAKITYVVTSIPHPWDEKDRKVGVTAYCLVKRTTPEYGFPQDEPVAMFNFDSEARQFAAHVFLAGLEGKLVEMDRDLHDLFESQRALKADMRGRRASGE